jgi:hypothetical protein
MEEQLEKELRFHLEQHTDELIAQGRSPDEARRQARLALGGPEQVKEYCRDARGTRWLEDVLQDFRYAVRTLRNQTGFAAVTVLILALGIGATTAIFSAVNLALFETLPYPHAGRLMMISDFGGSEDSRGYVAFHTYREMAVRSRSFDAIAVLKAWQPTLVGPAEPERFDGQFVSASFFHVLGVPPFLGRDFEASDDRFNGPKMVIGVMPTAFEDVLAPSAQLWTTLQYDTENISNVQTREWGNHLRMIERLQPGVSADQAKRELDAIGHTPVPEFPRAPWATHKEGFIVDSLHDNVTRSVKPALLAVLGAVLLVLVIACVNVTNLFLARGVRRRGEFALRTTLGAERGRLIRQLLTESLLLAAMGGIAGIAVAELGVRALVAFSPPELPRVGAITVDGPVFAFGLGITTLIGLGCGLIPALRASRNEPQMGLQESSPRTVGGHQRARSLLVVVEVALALVLLVGLWITLAEPEPSVCGRSGIRRFTSTHNAGADLRSSIRRPCHLHSFLRAGT